MLVEGEAVARVSRCRQILNAEFVGHALADKAAQVPVAARLSRCRRRKRHIGGAHSWARRQCGECRQSGNCKTPKHVRPSSNPALTPSAMLRDLASKSLSAT